MLELYDVSASYGSVPAIGDVTIKIGEGEAVGLLGANGAGKSTTLRAISGLVRLTSGTITFAGTDLASLPPHKITELGIAHVPEGRQVFPEMTVQENLEIGAYVPRAKAERAQFAGSRLQHLPAARRAPQTARRHDERRRAADARGRPRADAQAAAADAGRASLGLAPVMSDVTFEKIRKSTRWAPRSCWSSRMSAAR